MKLTVLTDNLSQRNDLLTEHGLSFYLEMQDKRILFDTGQSDAFLMNARKLDVDLRQTDYLVISHGHYDHTGGIGYFLSINPKAKIILKPASLEGKYKGDHYIGIPRDVIIPEERIIFADPEQEIIPDLFAVGKIDITRPSDTHFSGFQVRERDQFVPDSFSDELFMVADMPDGLVIITACSHHGITNIVETAKARFQKPVKHIFGGFHLKYGSDEEVRSVGEYLENCELETLVTGHCTGYENYELLKNNGLSRLNYSYTGNVYEINL